MVPAEETIAFLSAGIACCHPEEVGSPYEWGSEVISLKKFAWFFVLMATAGLAGPGNGDNQHSLGPGQTTVIDNPSPDDICPGAIFKTNDDGSYENGYAWQYAGDAAPYYGAWAEGFTMDYDLLAVCGMRFALTQVGNQDGWLMDVYVWDASGNNPNNVISMTPGINPGAVAMWPQISQHDININDASMGGDYFVGYWANWIGAAAGWYLAADENGFGGGLPRTNFAPGTGYPTGWNHPNLAFPNCMDLGIGTYENYGIDPVPVRENTWGAVKNLYH